MASVPSVDGMKYMYRETVLAVENQDGGKSL